MVHTRYFQTLLSSLNCNYWIIYRDRMKTILDPLPIKTIVGTFHYPCCNQIEQRHATYSNWRRKCTSSISCFLSSPILVDTIIVHDTLKSKMGNWPYFLHRTNKIYVKVQVIIIAKENAPSSSQRRREARVGTLDAYTKLFILLSKLQRV